MATNDLDLGILVLSSDKYSHLWPAFFKCFRKYFPDCRWPLYLGSNTIKAQIDGVKVLLSDGDPDWSTSLIRILDQIPQKYLFIILEDLFLASKMNTSHFVQAAEFLEKTKGKFIRYFPKVAPDSQVPGEPFGVYARGRPYRMSVVGFWDREYLRSLLIPGENPWNFEILGSYRTSYTDGFFGMGNPLCEFANLIEKGRWFPAAVAWAENEQLDIGRGERSVLGGTTRFKSKLQLFYYWLINKIDWRLRVRLMGFIRKLLISY